MKVSILAPLIFNIFIKVSVTPLVYALDTKVCDGAELNFVKWIGEKKNVEVYSVSCPNSSGNVRSLERRQISTPSSTATSTQATPPQASDVCNADCNTNCFPPGSGPEQNDCDVIQNALDYDSQSGNDLFTVPPQSNNAIVMKYITCENVFVNQAANLLQYCSGSWAMVMKRIWDNCPQGGGGNCVAVNQGESWYAQVNRTATATAT